MTNLSASSTTTTSSTAGMRVLISGAGVAGPALAWHLAKFGAQVTVLDRTESMVATGHNIDIHGSALKIVTEMGLRDQLIRNNTKELGTYFVNPKGTGSLASFPVRKGNSGSLTSEFEILRGDLAQMLYNASKDMASVKYAFGTTIKSVQQSEKHVTAALSDGTSHDYDVLVAADGQWSNVRKQCFDPPVVKDFKQYVLYGTIPRQPHDEDWWAVYLATKSRFCTIRPDPHGTMRAMLSYMPRKDELKEFERVARSTRQEQYEIMREKFQDVGWETQRLLKDMNAAKDLYFQQFQQIRMKKWSSGRVICIGDAAFAPTPLTGMGTSLAIIAARMLAGELSLLQPGAHPSSAFERYEASFRPFVKESQHVPSIVPRVAHPETKLGRWTVQTIMAVIAKIIAIPFVHSRLPKEEADDFRLTAYPIFATK